MNEQNIEYTKLVTFRCSWPSNVVGKDIKDCVATHIHFESESIEYNILSLIEESNCKCVNFTKPDGQNDFIVNISCHPKYLISTICVSSEAKTIELFGKTEEYVSTHSAVLSDNLDESQINFHSININKSECSLKFKQFENSDYIWIYGLIANLTEEKDELNPSLGPINIKNVQNLLNPELLATNASKLFSTISLKESKLIENINDKMETSIKGRQFINNNLMNFEKNVENKLNNMTIQINSIKDNMEILNQKFDTLLNILQKKNI